MTGSGGDDEPDGTTLREVAADGNCRTPAIPGSREPTDHVAEELLRALHQAYAGPLFLFALRLSGDRQRAEEVVQDALLRAWQHPEAVDGSKGSARAWLFSVVRNGVIDGWRRDGARPRVSGASASLDRAAGADGADQVERAVEAWGVADALRRLSPEHRQVLLHAFYLGHSVEQTSAALGVPAGTVKSRTYYALRALRVVLEETGHVR